MFLIPDRTNVARWDLLKIDEEWIFFCTLQRLVKLKKEEEKNIFNIFMRHEILKKINIFAANAEKKSLKSRMSRDAEGLILWVTLPGHLATIKPFYLLWQL